MRLAEANGVVGAVPCVCAPAVSIRMELIASRESKGTAVRRRLIESKRSGILGMTPSENEWPDTLVGAPGQFFCVSYR